MIKGIQTDDWLSLRPGRLLTEIEAECYTLFMCLDARSAYVTSPEENRGPRYSSRFLVFKSSFNAVCFVFCQFLLP